MFSQKTMDVTDTRPRNALSLSRPHRTTCYYSHNPI